MIQTIGDAKINCCKVALSSPIARTYVSFVISFIYAYSICDEVRSSHVVVVLLFANGAVRSNAW